MKGLCALTVVLAAAAVAAAAPAASADPGLLWDAEDLNRIGRKVLQGRPDLGAGLVQSILGRAPAAPAADGGGAAAAEVSPPAVPTITGVALAADGAAVAVSFTHPAEGSGTTTFAAELVPRGGRRGSPSNPTATGTSSPLLVPAAGLRPGVPYTAYLTATDAATGLTSGAARAGTEVTLPASGQQQEQPPTAAATEGTPAGTATPPSGNAAATTAGEGGQPAAAAAPAQEGGLEVGDVTSLPAVQDLASKGLLPGGGAADTVDAGLAARVQSDVDKKSNPADAAGDLLARVEDNNAGTLSLAAAFADAAAKGKQDAHAKAWAAATAKAVQDKKDEAVVVKTVNVVVTAVVIVFVKVGPAAASACLFAFANALAESGACSTVLPEVIVAFVTVIFKCLAVTKEVIVFG